MADPISEKREGNLEAPTRHPLDWTNPEFMDQQALDAELERVFNICHGCRRCVSLCHAFPTLFDLIDESKTMEIDGVDKADYPKVTEQCYLCDLCYQTKCPYTPPHPWNVDFPHLMLRAKAVAFERDGVPLSAKILSNTRMVGKLASIPVVVQTINAANHNKLARKLLEKTMDVDADARVPSYYTPSARKRLKALDGIGEARPAGRTRGKLAIFATCYCDYCDPIVVEDLAAVMMHNAIPTRLVEQESCCGMPKFELGDLQTVKKYKERNIPVLAKMARDGWDFTAAIPSCVLMFKQELPLMFPDDAEVALVRDRFFDPFEYLAERHKAGLLATDFKQSLGKVAWQVPCHQRVQKIGPKTRDILQLAPDTEVVTIERCSGHDGTYGVKHATYALSRKLAKPVESRVAQAQADHFTSDCPMAGNHIAHGLGDKPAAEHPLSLLRKAYGV
ncbi:heterodisulfide reductase-related iron-sulfur binding cluster [Rhodanobacter sp. MP7CTX1]|jgi:glycerol-3-phosphate dehydrogenase subunit C|uniref:heterodisulfide reductase-related iron-sulfur binding cluster n=1 Tax=Rhodanobacter sp. MP7CTX1 TaxID=2723084 RepID=UPI0016162227|nr:heterodisulfide reductase-related iron-sulfur binding cluster [Rhodanobacter sp. MP7CTX1]MBB6186390.1 Fe-S oxidoreductase [Rhodanobacter sp. MP7CTX1]